ncbi:MAG: hypothetical protein WD407_10330 [Rhodospirillales bacterium]
METKQTFQQKIKAQKAEIQAGVNELKVKARKLEAEGRRDLADVLETIERKRVQADAKLREIQNEGADAWEDSKSGVEAVYADLCKTVSNTAEKFR